MDVRKWLDQQIHEAHKECPHNYIPDDAGCTICISNQIIPAITKMVEALRQIDFEIQGGQNVPSLKAMDMVHGALAELEKP